MCSLDFVLELNEWGKGLCRWNGVVLTRWGVEVIKDAGERGQQEGFTLGDCVVSGHHSALLIGWINDLSGDGA